MAKPGKGSICEIYSKTEADTLENVICTRTSKNFFWSIDGPEAKLVQYPLSAVRRILEGPEAIRAYRKIMRNKGK